jgi:hypothetical protein
MVVDDELARPPAPAARRWNNTITATPVHLRKAWLVAEALKNDGFATEYTEDKHDHPREIREWRLQTPP